MAPLLPYLKKVFKESNSPPASPQKRPSSSRRFIRRGPPTSGPNTRKPPATRPDGTLLDDFRIPRGYWEAKDTKDDLEAEIRAKSSSATTSATPSLRTPAAPSCSKTSSGSWRPT